MSNIKETTISDINTQGFNLRDNRLNRETRVINGYTIEHEYPEPLESSPLNPKYEDDWFRMYKHFLLACEELTKDEFTRRAVILNTRMFEKNYPCFLSLQILHNQKDNSYDCVVYQRSSDVEKLEDDISFFEYVMYKVQNKIGKNVNRLIIMMGSVHVKID